MTSKMLACCSVALLSLILLGQATMPVKVPATAPATAPAPDSLKLMLMDGSQLTGKLSINELVIETRFGTLKVPVDAIKSFTPGLGSHPEFEKQIAAMINDLGSDSYPDREKAEQGLMKLGPAIAGELKTGLKTADGEKKTRLEKILGEFESLREEDDADVPAEWNREDVIVTGSFTIVGRITTNAFVVSSSYGTLQLKLADVERTTRQTPEREEIRKNIVVSGNLIPNHGFESSVRVNKGDQISITATGSITMTPWGNNACGPDGGQNYGMVGNIPGGTLIARIGNGGPFIKVGSKHSFTADRAGVLQFGVAIGGDFTGNEFPGEYNVKLRVLRK